MLGVVLAHGSTLKFCRIVASPADTINWAKRPPETATILKSPVLIKYNVLSTFAYLFMTIFKYTLEHMNSRKCFNRNK